MDNKGQVSAELIIVVAAVIAVALLFVTSLHSTADDGKAVLDKNAASALKEAKKL
jgi:uncharacterized protein (UPF0333 family)